MFDLFEILGVAPPLREADGWPLRAVSFFLCLVVLTLAFFITSIYIHGMPVIYRQAAVYLLLIFIGLSGLLYYGLLMSENFLRRRNRGNLPADYIYTIRVIFRCINTPSYVLSVIINGFHFLLVGALPLGFAIKIGLQQLARMP